LFIEIDATFALRRRYFFGEGRDNFGPLNPVLKRGDTMMKSFTALAAAAAISAAAIAAPTSASARGGAVAAGVIGGLAAGAIIGSAAANANGGYYAYGPGPVYYNAGPRCYLTRQRVWTNFGPRWQRVRVCDGY
jgi:hypothetical protein